MVRFHLRRDGRLGRSPGRRLHVQVPVRAVFLLWSNARFVDRVRKTKSCQLGNDRELTAAQAARQAAGLEPAMVLRIEGSAEGVRRLVFSVLARGSASSSEACHASRTPGVSWPGETVL